ncbi:hypothetical protein [Oceanobacillus salinisoli]|uniref:hypothetical protein n=1 Tax=Oceanobacillus salinisoli TaxID=2678611 RepID=UPI0012E13147|nr:hypothetical protein [Oceanobacillus salinisoli]
MNEERFDRLEDMMTTLINTVGKIMENQTTTMSNDINEIKTEQSSMRDDINEIKTEQNSMQDKMDEMQKENDTRHKEVIEKLTSIEADQEHIWGKSARNEREFARFKNMYGL